MAEYNLTRADRQKWLNNSLIFLAPLFVLYLVFVQTGITSDGFSMSDFIPTQEVIGGLILYIINTLLDLLRKFVANGTK